MYTVGYDIGTRFIKICLARDGKAAGFEVTEPGRDIRKAIDSAYRKLLKKSGLRSWKVGASAATGFGASYVKRAKFRIDLPHCIARGAFAADSSVGTVIDAGGLFINIVQVGEQGRVVDSVENEKCAAGSGRFLETIAAAVELPLSGFSEEIRRSASPCPIQNTCSVFAESEIISRVNRGERREDIICGMVRSLAARIETMLGVINGRGPFALAGGVSCIEAYREIMEERLGAALLTLPVDSRIVVAYGAALIAADRITRGL